MASVTWKIQNAIHLQLRVVAGDAHLAGDIERNLFEHVFVGHAVDKGHQKIEARCERAVVFAQALHHPGVLLGHHFDGPCYENHGNHQQGDCDF